MVSLVARPATPLAIFLHHQASKFLSSCQAHCWALSWRASSVSCSSSEDDSLDSLEGVSSLGLGWHCFRWVDWIFSSLSDSASVFLCVLKMWLTPERVFGWESSPDPHCHRRPPGHRSRPQLCPRGPPHTHLHGGHPSPCGRVWICCWFPGCHWGPETGWSLITSCEVR